MQLHPHSLPFRPQCTVQKFSQHPEKSCTWKVLSQGWFHWPRTSALSYIESTQLSRMGFPSRVSMLQLPVPYSRDWGLTDSKILKR